MASPRQLGVGMLVLGWVAGMVLLVQFFSPWEEHPPRYEPHIHQEADFTEVAIQAQGRDQDHFLLNGYINGYPVTFLVDTGAQDVALSAQLARRLGLRTKEAVLVTTAGGEVTGYRTQLQRLELGDIHLQAVPAVLLEDFDSSVVLLGMSALRQLEFSQSGGTLVLRQYRMEPH